MIYAAGVLQQENEECVCVFNSSRADYKVYTVQIKSRLDEDMNI